MAQEWSLLFTQEKPNPVISFLENLLCTWCFFQVERTAEGLPECWLKSSPLSENSEDTWSMLGDSCEGGHSWVRGGVGKGDREKVWSEV